MLFVSSSFRYMKKLWKSPLFPRLGCGWTGPMVIQRVSDSRSFPSLESKVDKSMLAKIKPLHLERIGAQPSRKEGIQTFVTSPRQKWRPELWSQVTVDFDTDGSEKNSSHKGFFNTQLVIRLLKVKRHIVLGTKISIHIPSSLVVEQMSFPSNGGTWAHAHIQAYFGLMTWFFLSRLLTAPFETFLKINVRC